MLGYNVKALRVYVTHLWHVRDVVTGGRSGLIPDILGLTTEEHVDRPARSSPKIGEVGRIGIEQ